MKKKVLVILPGWGGSHETWQPFVDAAKEKIERVIVIELPCFGNEPCPATVWGVEEYADFVHTKIGQLKLDPKTTVLLGHSFGGAVAVAYASRYQDTISHLFLVAAAILRPKRTLKRTFFRVIAWIGKRIFSLPILRNTQTIAKKVLYRFADSPDYNNTSGVKRDIFKKIIRQDQSSLLINIAVPTTIIWGTRDRMTPIQDVKKIQKLLSHSSVHIIEGGRHGLHHSSKDDLLDTIYDAL